LQNAVVAASSPEVENVLHEVAVKVKEEAVKVEQAVAYGEVKSLKDA
jgi:hypothetical protein